MPASLLQQFTTIPGRELADSMILQTLQFASQSRSGRAATLVLLAATMTSCRTSSTFRNNESPRTTASSGMSATGFASRKYPHLTEEQPERSLNSHADAKFSTTSDTQTQLVAYTHVNDSYPNVPSVPTLSFEEAIATSLDRNPALLTLRANEPVAHAAFHVAETYPFNPTVQVQVLPYARDKSGEKLGVNHYVWLNQTLELAHQTRHREASASAFLNQVKWNIVQAELTNVAQTHRLYFAALYQRDIFELAKQTAKLNEDLNGIVARRFKAGIATAAEQTTAKVAVRQSRRQAELAEANYQTAHLVLQRQLNLQSNEPFSLVGRLDDFEWPPVPGSNLQEELDPSCVNDHESRITELAFGRPDVLAAHAGVDVAKANAALARANQIQNLGLGPFYERDESGTVFWGLRTSMNLPLWDTGRPLTAQRVAEQNLQLTTFNQLRLRARTEAETAIERYDRARQLASHEISNPSGTTTEELENIQKQFNSGQADILNVFAAQNGLLQERRTHLDLLNEVAQSAADVTLFAGIPPTSLLAHRPIVNRSSAKLLNSNSESKDIQ